MNVAYTPVGPISLGGVVSLAANAKEWMAVTLLWTLAISWTWTFSAKVACQPGWINQTLSLLMHWNWSHLVFNVLGLWVVFLWGVSVGVGPAHTVLWVLCWPLSALAIQCFRGDTCTYGISGQIYSGVAIGAMQLMLEARVGLRRLGGTVLVCQLAMVGVDALQRTIVLPTSQLERSFKVDWLLHLIGITCAALGVVVTHWMKLLWNKHKTARGAI